MTSAAIIFESSTGITRQFAEEIGDYFAGQGIEARVASIDDCDPADLGAVDYVLLGCWTNGLMIALQHPTDRWVTWARRLPAIPSARLALFTTYKIATGRMFGQMRSRLPPASRPGALELKSRNGHLSEANRQALATFIGART
jgi:sulfite reductase alpha subunit-like flavoprotein